MFYIMLLLFSNEQIWKQNVFWNTLNDDACYLWLLTFSFFVPFLEENKPWNEMIHRLFFSVTCLFVCFVALNEMKWCHRVCLCVCVCDIWNDDQWIIERQSLWYMIVMDFFSVFLGQPKKTLLYKKKMKNNKKFSRKKNSFNFL